MEKDSGFTIVELLVAIVVIGILAAITIISYVGIQQKAIIASLQSDLANGSQQLKLFQAEKSSYPTSIIDCPNPASGNLCLKSSDSNSYQYLSGTNPQVFCIAATNGSNNYNITQDSLLLSGPCPALNLDAGNGTSYPKTGSTWYDLSGNADNGTLVNGTSFSNAAGGAMSFNGVDNRVETSLKTYGNNMTWAAWINCNQSVNTINMFMGRYLPYFGVYTGTKIMFSVNIGGSQRTIYGPANILLNTWYYTAFTIEYDGINTTAKIYVNGDMVSSGTWAGAQVNISHKFTIGDGYETTWYPFKGMVSAVKVYNGTLLSLDIQQNFNASKSRYGL